MEKALTAAEGTTTTATIGSGRYQHNPYSHTVLAGGREDANILSRTMETARKLGSVTARQNNCYMLVAQCLMDVLADKATECTAKTLAETAKSLKLWQGRRQEHRDPLEVLEKYNIHAYPYGRPTEESTTSSILGTVYPDDTTHRFIVRSENEPLPPTVTFQARDTEDVNSRTSERKAVFHIGTHYAGDGMVGHYTLTTEPAEATLAVYEMTPNRCEDTLRDIAWIDAIEVQTADEPEETQEADHSDGRSDEADSEDSDDLDPEEELMDIVRHGKEGQRILMVWSRRDIPHEAPSRWTGMITKQFDARYRCCQVKWDAGLPNLKGPRTRPLPEAVLPDPKIRYHQTILIPHRKDKEPQKPETEVPRNEVPAELRAPSSKNVDGNLAEGTQRCRGWYIHPDCPPHVAQLAWAALSDGVRASHIRWLRELRSMPADLITQPLPKAAIELVRRMAVARHWRWGTISRALSNIRSALQNLPLYTNETRSVDVFSDPEWRAVSRTAKRMERETPTKPPEPLSYEEMVAARKELGEKPLASLFLTLMWSFAARASDIAGLNQEDLKMVDPDKVAATVRRGKGAKFRGPYPVASTLPRPYWLRLQEHRTQRREGERLFPNLAQLRDTVRAALKKINPTCSLPSIRKGAARHMIEAGSTEAEVMRLTGHTRPDTLKRYLGWSETLSKEARNAQENTRQLQQPLPRRQSGHLAGGEPKTGPAGVSHQPNYTASPTNLQA